MQKVRILFGYGLLVIFINHACISHVICICIRVAATAEEVVYEVVAEPQGPQGQATGASGASPAGGGSRGVGPRPKSPQC